MRKENEAIFRKPYMPKAYINLRHDMSEMQIRIPTGWLKIWHKMLDVLKDSLCIIPTATEKSSNRRQAAVKSR